MDDRRRSVRHRMLKPARIVFDRRFSPVDCTLRNLSDHGAMLSLPTRSAIPYDFDLELGWTASVHRCRLVWRQEDRVGVQFVA
jgi:hypothetical protein